MKKIIALLMMAVMMLMRYRSGVVLDELDSLGNVARA